MKPKKEYLFPGEPFKPLRCGVANHALAHVPQNIKHYQQDKLANILTYTHGKLTIKIDGSDKPVPDSAWRMLDFFMLEFTRQNTNKNSTSVKIQFDDFAEYRNAKDQKARLRLRQQMKNNLEILYKVSVDWNEPVKKYCLKSRLIYSAAYMESKQTLKVNFVPEFAQYITKGYLMPFDSRLGALDSRNPNIHKIGRKLIHHYMMLSNRERGMHNRLSLKKILEAAPDIPTSEEVCNKYDRNYKNKIIIPVKNCLDGLVDAGILEKWDYRINANQELTGNEFLTMEWNIIKNCMILYELNLPQPQEVLF